MGLLVFAVTIFAGTIFAAIVAAVDASVGSYSTIDCAAEGINRYASAPVSAAATARPTVFAAGIVRGFSGG